MSHTRILRAGLALAFSALAVVLAVVTGCTDNQIASVNLPQTRTLTLTLGEVSSSGAVVVGSTVTDATVTLSPVNSGTVVVSNGVATIKLLADGTYTVTITSPTHVTITRSFIVAVPKGSTGVDTAVTLNMARKATAESVAVTNTVVAGVTKATTAATTTVVEAVVAGEAPPANANDVVKLAIPPSTDLTVNGVAPTAPVEISVTPVPAVATPTISAPEAEGQTVSSDKSTLGGFVLEPVGLATSKPMTISVPLDKIGIDKQFALDNQPFNMENYNPSTGDVIPLAGTATYALVDGVDCLVFTVSNFSTGAAFSRGRTTSGQQYLRRLLLNYRISMTSSFVKIGSKSATTANTAATLAFRTQFTGTGFGQTYLWIVMDNMGYLRTLLGDYRNQSVTAPAKANNIATVTAMQLQYQVKVMPRNSSVAVSTGNIYTHTVTQVNTYKATTTGITGGG
jgi:hypothetical protein